MVLIFNNGGHSASRFIEGLDVIMPEDILFIKDKTGKERILYLTNGNACNLGGFDVGAETFCSFEGDVLDIAKGWSGHGYVDVPSIEDWGVLYDSEIQNRDAFNAFLFPRVIQGELFLEKMVQQGSLYLLGQKRRGILFESLGDESLEMYNRGLEELPSEKLEKLRQNIPREAIETSCRRFREAIDRGKKPEEWRVGIINPEYELGRIPYKPLEDVIKTIPIPV